jgi:hypothetical protein
MALPFVASCARVQRCARVSRVSRVCHRDATRASLTERTAEPFRDAGDDAMTRA